MAVSLRCTNAPSSARLFVQLAKRPTTSYETPAVTLPILDVLAPRANRRTTTASYSTSAFSSPSPRPLWNATRPSGVPRIRFQTRGFIATPTNGTTTCVHNQLQDDDGNDMTLQISDRAGKRLAQIMKKDSNPNLALRVAVESGGCHGFQYELSLITLPDGRPGTPEWSRTIKEEDCVLQYTPEGEEAPSALMPGAPKVVVDQPSLELLTGSKVDFTSELIGSQFKIVDMPNAGSSCGCGTSFDIKD